MKLFSLSILSAAILSFGGYQGTAQVAPGDCGPVPPSTYCGPGYGLVCSKKPEKQQGSWACVPAGGCIATCADGYEYRKCTEDGFPINYFVDPCMGHSGAASSTSAAAKSSRSSAASCDESERIECAPSQTLVCESGRWTCNSRRESRAFPPLTITSITPDPASPRMMVTIEGTGFSKQNNIIMFAESVITNVRSRDGTHLTFRVPSRTTNPCRFKRGERCTVPIRTYGPGTYDVQVIVSIATSNTLPLTLE